MKKYLFGLGAMVVGAGLMFVLMHGEVRADDRKMMHCESYEPAIDSWEHETYKYCKIKDMTCVSARNGRLSCVKS